MRFEIPFDPSISAQQYELRLTLGFKKNLFRNGKTLFYSTIILFFGWLMISDRDVIGYIFISMGFFYLFSALIYFWHYKKMTTKLRRIHKNMIELRVKNNDLTIWEFNGDNFRYNDMYYDYSIKWEAFKGYKIVEQNLFLMLAEAIDQSFIIGEIEVGSEQFAEIITLLDGKMKNLTDQKTS